MTAEAAAVAAALAARTGVPVAAVPVDKVQARLREFGVVLGVPGEAAAMAAV